MRTLNSAHAPSHSAIINMCQLMIRGGASEEAVIVYLSNIASNDFSCPDRCDKWACDFWEAFEDEIYEQWEMVEVKNG